MTRLAVPVRHRAEIATVLLVLVVFPLGWAAGRLQHPLTVHDRVKVPAPIRSLKDVEASLGEPQGQVEVSGHSCVGWAVSDGVILGCP